MSTNLYNGFELLPAAGSELPLDRLGEVLAFCDELRGELLPVAERALNRHIAREVVALIDRAAVGKGSVPKNPLSTVATDVRDRQRVVDQRGTRDPEIDFEVILTFFPYHQGRVLGLYSIEQRDLVAAFRKHPRIDDYSITDAVDRPDTVSEQAWDERCEAWNAVLLNGTGGPAHRGLACTIIHNRGLDLPSPEDIVSLVPPMPERVAKIARSHVFDQKLAQREEEIRQSCQKEQRMPVSEIMQIDTWLNTPEGQEAVKGAAFDFADMLPEITPEVLLGRRETATQE